MWLLDLQAFDIIETGIVFWHIFTMAMEGTAALLIRYLF